MTLFVMSRANEFRPLRATLLPGAIVPEDETRDRRALVDLNYHHSDLALLQLLNAVSAPQAGLGSPGEEWYALYMRHALTRYRETLGSHARPREDYLVFGDRAFAGPLTVLESLSDEGRMLFTEAALGAEVDIDPWPLFHKSQRDRYPVVEIESPLVWRIRAAGRLRTSLGPQPPGACVGPSIDGWSDVLPVAQVSGDVSDLLELPSSIETVSVEIWQAAVDRAHVLSDDVLLGHLYVEASARILTAPEHVRCRVGKTFGPAAPGLVTIVHDRRELNALMAQRVPSLLVATANDADMLRLRWGFNTAQIVETTLAYTAAGEATPLLDRFPALSWYLDKPPAGLTLIPCIDLRLETTTSAGREDENISFYVDEDRVYFDEALGAREVLDRLAPFIGLEGGHATIEEILTRGAEVERRRLTDEIRELSSPALRLLEAVGAVGLRSRLPKGLLAALESNGVAIQDEEVAVLAMAVHGLDVLRVYRDEIGDRGLQPPSQWAGSAAALSFVRRLGFSRDYAGFEQPSRSPLLEVEGPPELPALHGYQRLIVDEFRALVRGDRKGRRALLSLPTGAGKTRVIVEAIIEALLHKEIVGPILWVAQNDELCEQAVQTWSHVWRGVGPARERLAVNRLWSSNEAEPVAGAVQIVVATIDKLNAGVIRDQDYAWLATAGCVVVDEAHHSTTPSYTALLQWQGLERSRDSRPLIGLSATPFRGVNVKESEQLVARYFRQRLDGAAFGDQDPYPILQDQGVLARVRHRVLDGSEVELTADELRALKATPHFFPRSVEARLGLDADRNRRILEAIQSLPSDWTILVFAASVDHAQTMAALLTLDNIPAQAITGRTEPGPRRRYVEQFRAGTLRVLTNYGVLTQGFDAPSVGAIIIGRPTYSTNLYQQMVGRGLRGPLNGGKEECLVVDVHDNVRQFRGALTFRDFEYMWTGAPSQTA